MKCTRQCPSCEDPRARERGNSLVVVACDFMVCLLELSGGVSREVCRDAVRSLISQAPQQDIPAVLR